MTCFFFSFNTELYRLKKVYNLLVMLERSFIQFSGKSYQNVIKDYYLLLFILPKSELSSDLLQVKEQYLGLRQILRPNLRLP